MHVAARAAKVQKQGGGLSAIFKYGQTLTQERNKWERVNVQEQVEGVSLMGSEPMG